MSTATPIAGQPGNSTIRWTAGLPVHPEAENENDFSANTDQVIPKRETPPAPRKPITPSLATLEKAVAARIYFENLYFPLLRHPPSREQRRMAMEKEMMALQLTEEQKDFIRGKWRRNETEYLRERRRKVDVNAFVKLKTIGHGRRYSRFPCGIRLTVIYHCVGAFGVVSLVRDRSSGQLFAMKQVTTRRQIYFPFHRPYLSYPFQHSHGNSSAPKNGHVTQGTRRPCTSRERCP